MWDDCGPVIPITLRTEPISPHAAVYPNPASISSWLTHIWKPCHAEQISVTAMCMQGNWFISNNQTLYLLFKWQWDSNSFEKWQPSSLACYCCVNWITRYNRLCHLGFWCCCKTNVSCFVSLHLLVSVLVIIFLSLFLFSFISIWL